MAEAKKRNMNKCDKRLQRASWIAGVITSVALAIFAGVQLHINYRLLKEDHLLNQPVFQVQKMITKSEGSDVYDHEDIEVYNHGEMAKDIESVSLNTYISFVYTPDIMKQTCDTFYVPVYYYGAKYTTYNLTGLIAYTQTSQLNLKSYARIYREVLHSSHYPLIADVDKVTIVVVNYIDKLDKPHTVSFMNGKSVTESRVAFIKEQSNVLTNYKIYEIDDLSYDKLREICHCEK